MATCRSKLNFEIVSLFVEFASYYKAGEDSIKLAIRKYEHHVQTRAI